MNNKGRIFPKGTFVQTATKKGELFTSEHRETLIKSVVALELEPIWELILLSQSVSNLNVIINGDPN